MALAVACVAAGWLAPGAEATTGRARGGDVGAAEAASLMREAVDDPAALAELRGVDSIDGRPVDLTAAVEGPDDGRPERLEALADLLEPTADGTSGPPAPPADSRATAESVLEADKYQENRLPQPFRGPLAWIADRLATVGGWMRPLFDNPVTAVFFLISAAGLIVFAAVLSVRRRVLASVRKTRREGNLVDPELDPEELDRLADEAQAAGSFADVVRYRYEAGLIRLVRLDRLTLRPDTTARGAADQVSDPTMHRLTDTFEAVVYGGRRAVEADAAEARSGWSDLLGTKVGR